MHISSWRELVAAVRMGKYADGGYPLFYVTQDGQALSYDHVRAEILDEARKVRTGERERIVACDVNWEDPALYCDASGERIESAYAEHMYGDDAEPAQS